MFSVSMALRTMSSMSMSRSTRYLKSSKTTSAGTRLREPCPRDIYWWGPRPRRPREQRYNFESHALYPCLAVVVALTCGALYTSAAVLNKQGLPLKSSTRENAQYRALLTINSLVGKAQPNNFQLIAIVNVCPTVHWSRPSVCHCDDERIIAT